MNKGMISDALVFVWQQFFCDVIVVASSRAFLDGVSVFGPEHLILGPFGRIVPQ